MDNGTEIIVAVIGSITTIAAALISFFASRRPEPRPQPQPSLGADPPRATGAASVGYYSSPSAGRPAQPGAIPAQPGYPQPSAPQSPGYPAQPVSGNPAASGGYPTQPVSGNPAASGGYPGQPVSGNPAASGGYPGQPVSGSPVGYPNRPVSGSSPAGYPSAAGYQQRPGYPNQPAGYPGPPGSGQPVIGYPNQAGGYPAQPVGGRPQQGGYHGAVGSGYQQSSGGYPPVRGGAAVVRVFGAVLAFLFSLVGFFLIADFIYIATTAPDRVTKSLVVFLVIEVVGALAMLNLARVLIRRVGNPRASGRKPVLFSIMVGGYGLTLLFLMLWIQQT